MKKIDVPESITRQAYVDLMASVGFDAKSLRSLEFRMDGIYAEVFDRDEQGRIRIDKTLDEVVVNKVFIPVADEPPVP